MHLSTLIHIYKQTTNTLTRHCPCLPSLATFIHPIHRHLLHHVQSAVEQRLLASNHLLLLPGRQHHLHSHRHQHGQQVHCRRGGARLLQAQERHDPFAVGRGCPGGSQAAVWLPARPSSTRCLHHPHVHGAGEHVWVGRCPGQHRPPSGRVRGCVLTRVSRLCGAVCRHRGDGDGAYPIEDISSVVMLCVVVG